MSKNSFWFEFWHSCINMLLLSHSHSPVCVFKSPDRFNYFELKSKTVKLCQILHIPFPIFQLENCMILHFHFSFHFNALFYRVLIWPRHGENVIYVLQKSNVQLLCCCFCVLENKPGLDYVWSLSISYDEQQLRRSVKWTLLSSP